MKGTTAAGLGLMAALARDAALDRRAVLDECLLDAEVPVDVPGSKDWELDLSCHNERAKYTPVAIAVPATVDHIQAAVSCGAKAGIKVTPKAGGHSYASLGLGGEDGHLVIILDRMHNVKLDTETNIATVDPDWVNGMTVVLANSTIVHASETENSDLFWAMLGAGSNFGVVASYEFKTFEAPANVTWFIASLPWNKRTAVAGLEALEAFTRNTMAAELNMRVVGTARNTQIEGSYHGDEAGLRAAIEPFLEKVGGRLVRAKTENWIKSLEHYANAKLDQTHPYQQTEESFYAKSLQLTGLNGTAAQNFVDYWFDVARGVDRIWYFQLDMHGGQHSSVSKLNVETTSYAHRDKLYLIQFYDREISGHYPDRGFSFLDGWVSKTTAPLSPSDWGMYINYADTSLNRTTAQHVYWGKNLARLQTLKAKFDPEELFYYPSSINPVPIKEAERET
ncbi:hypothetical protein DL766_009460 [Monosporascus sp. MC13-8B]|uniref:FAD-binding PCMH-type domain-containing protein n=1 Tax=Monosporascus cannonballus TaxID=155416 RepID=A0ABY0GSW8_9PEZI|nr:hypothetical protein DL762_009778 [Monosporascus cannonballus]RYO77415.1 hypothetical protein DL763_009984 [Monosporascus cannonballus]RYP15190.1 hypothetical protein DL766_009460 [Monosporascus sp. MC13-8B]